MKKIELAINQIHTICTREDEDGDQWACVYLTNGLAYPEIDIITFDHVNGTISFCIPEN